VLGVVYKRKNNLYMMKYYFTIIIMLMFIGCKKEKPQKQEISHKEYYIPVEGSRIHMKIDSTSTIEELIPRLITNHKLHDTGKGYWIGYNDLMFSIAVHSDSAIDPLLNFIDTTKCNAAKFAAFYTIHLIGINCKIQGRFYEEFVDLKARDALFKLLAQNDYLRSDAMRLLIRDPRESDVPKLFDILDSTSTDCWQITSGLLRYDLKDKPFAQKVPQELLEKKIKLKNQIDFPDEELFRGIMREFSRKYSRFVKVEKVLYEYNYQIPTIIGVRSNEITVGYLTRLCNLTDYSSISPNFQYSYKDGKIKFFSAQTTKNIWLDWWKNQRDSYKDSLRHSYKKMEFRKF
jgi:hypothetical protein